MQVVEFNTMEAERAAELVRPCVAIDSFASTLVAGRPYADRVALLRRAEAQVAGWTDAEVAEALRDHPRIGERHAGGGASAAMSRDEQAGLGTEPELAQRLAEGNRRYEERFGRIYLVRARGRSAEELLALLERRLDNDDVTEAAVVKQQLGEIAVLRLAALFEDVA